MAWPKITVTDMAVETPRDSYKLEHITVVSVRRPFLPLGIMAILGGGAFAWRFSDLLYPHEIVTLCTAIALMCAAGIFVGHLQLLSRDLRGSELAGAAWGLYSHLNSVRRQIMIAAQTKTAQVSS